MMKSLSNNQAQAQIQTQVKAPKLKLVRLNVFETNSSSCHSLTFANKGVDKLSLKSELIRVKNSYKHDKNIPITLTHYCHCDNPLKTVEDKLSYILSDLFDDFVTHKEMNTKIKFNRYNLTKEESRVFILSFESSREVVDLKRKFNKWTGLNLSFKYDDLSYICLDHEISGSGYSLLNLKPDELYAFLFSQENFIKVKHDG